MARQLLDGRRRLGRAWPSNRSDDALTWARQPGTILRDDPRAHHADVLVRDGRALLYYFTPTGERTSAVGVAELDLRDGRLTTS
ncbi:hypothetical protein [Nonomuraea dietziae]|uniref:hypothetical protein n=1 Tax=Nonomuraea dietziae TaxID=65515 RepID=UPI0031DB210A